MAELIDFQTRLKSLSDDYAATLPEKLDQIEQAWSRVPRGNWDEESFQNLHRLVHSVTGSGATFGLALLSESARNLEEYLKRLADEKTVPSQQQRERIQILLKALHQGKRVS